MALVSIWGSGGEDDEAAFSQCNLLRMVNIVYRTQNIRFAWGCGVILLIHFKLRGVGEEELNRPECLQAESNPSRDE